MNRLLSITRNSIPYIKELRPYAGSVAACIIMQQLDYWFDMHPDGFYKFLEPCDHKDYRVGDSFTEELGVSGDEFRTAFDKIGLRHPSKTAYDTAEDKFKGCYYCSFHDKKQGLTWYFRNHAVVDTVIDEILSKGSTRPATVAGKRQLQEPANASYRNGDRQLHNLPLPTSIAGESQLSNTATPRSLVSTNITAENTQKTHNTVVVADASLVAEMRHIGVLGTAAERLLREQGPDECARQLKWLPERNAADPAAVFVTAVREQWAAPKYYNGSAEPETPKIDPAALDAAVERATEARYSALSPEERADVDREVGYGDSLAVVMERRYMIRKSAELAMIKAAKE